MKCLASAAFLIVFLMCGSRLVAQTGVSYPEVSALRAVLLKLAEEKKTAFQNIKGAFRYKKNTVAYYSASVHIVNADTPKIAEDTNPLQAYYMDFLAKELSEPQSKEAFVKWQDLVQAALPDYGKQVAGNQYPDLESWDFVSPDGGTKFTLYRNGSSAACQVSIVIINSNVAELQAAVLNRPQASSVAEDNSASTSVNTINKEEFSRQLKQLLSLAKTSFMAIKGAEEKGHFMQTFKTDFRLSGAKVVSVRNEDVAMSYVAVYANDKNSSGGDVLFEQLRKLVSDAIPGTFVNKGVVDKDGNKTLKFADKGHMQKVTLSKSDYSPSRTHYTVSLSVEQYEYWLE